VRSSGVVQDSLGRRSLASINVRHDADVTITIEWGFARHVKLPKRFRLPAVVRERFVGFRHTMRIFALFHCAATAISCL
jgi:predicted metallo-beta-lactamase superfamily hydrolase